MNIQGTFGKSNRVEKKPDRLISYSDEEAHVSSKSNKVKYIKENEKNCINILNWVRGNGADKCINLLLVIDYCTISAF